MDLVPAQDGRRYQGGAGLTGDTRGREGATPAGVPGAAPSVHGLTDPEVFPR